MEETGEVSIWIEEGALTEEAKERWKEWDTEKEGYLLGEKAEVEEMYVEKETGNLYISWNSKGVSGSLTIPAGVWMREMINKNWEGSLAEFITKSTKALSILLNIRAKVEKKLKEENKKKQ